MPRNQFQRMIFALLTVIVTVHAYVFYSLYVVNGDALKAAAGETGVLAAIGALGGVYMFGTNLPIWAVLLVEFAFAYTLEVIVGQRFSFRFASKVFDPRATHPVLFETAIICATVGIMCPSMSLIAAFLYYPYYEGFNFFTLFADWGKLVCYNFPFAFFTQLFLIQPLIRTAFRLLFRRDIQRHSGEKLVSEEQSQERQRA